MSQRNKFIVLAALLIVLGIIALVQFGGGQSPRRNQDASPAPRAPATAPAEAAEAKPADSAQDSGPSTADLRELADWLDLLRPAGTVIAKGGTPVLGIVMKPEVPPLSVAPSEEPGQIPWITEPGKLEGIVKVGNGPNKAVFQGEVYQVGDKVRGTTFTIVKVDDDSVTLKSGDRVIQRFWHD